MKRNACRYRLERVYTYLAIRNGEKFTLASVIQFSIYMQKCECESECVCICIHNKNNDNKILTSMVIDFFSSNFLYPSVCAHTHTINVQFLGMEDFFSNSKPKFRNICVCATLHT